LGYYGEVEGVKGKKEGSSRVERIRNVLNSIQKTDKNLHMENNILYESYLVAYPNAFIFALFNKLFYLTSFYYHITTKSL